MQIMAIQSYKSNIKNNKQPHFKGNGVGDISQVVQKVTKKDDVFVIDFVNQEVKNAYEKFAEFYSREKQRNIPKAFSSCMNSDGTVSDYALKTLDSLYISNFVSNLSKSIKILLKLMLNMRISNNDCSPSAEFLLEKISNIIASCKDSSGNINDKNIKMAQHLFSLSSVNKEDIPDIINVSKNKDGVFIKEDIDWLEKILTRSKDARLILDKIHGKNGDISDSVKKFVNKYEPKYSYIADILEKTKEYEKRDDILDFLTKDCTLEQAGFIPVHGADKNWFSDVSGKMNLEYLKTYFENINEDIIKEIPVRCYYSENDNILKENIKQIKRLVVEFTNYYSYGSSFYYSDISEFTESKYFKNNDVVNKDFIDFILKKMNFKQLHNRDAAYPYIDTSINYAKDKDNNIDWNVATFLLRFAHKIADSNYVYKENGRILRIKYMLYQMSELLKDNNGNFSKDNIVKEMHFMNQNFITIDFDDIEKNLTKKFLPHIVKNKNIYQASEMLEILENSNLTNKFLTTNIPGGYENLLFAIAGIPRETDPENYEKIIKKLSKVKNIDFNIKDSKKNSLLERILINENKPLLKLISEGLNPRLNYLPELDLAYKNISDDDFKQMVDKNLNLRFPLLEEAVKIHSIEAFKKAESQLESPLCHKKNVISDLWTLVIKNYNRDFCDFFTKKYFDELPETFINDLAGLKTQETRHAY